jgi:hypothetical protein
VWALPFLTVLAPGAKSDEAAGNRHQTSGDWVRQMLCQIRRWLPTQPLILVVDGGLVALKLAFSLCGGYFMLRCSNMDKV